MTTSMTSALAYEAVGAGPAVVLVHGLTESRRVWDPFVEPLAVDHTVVTLDLPGHGDSRLSSVYDTGTLVDAVAAVVAATGIDRPLLVGHSLGAWVVTAAARALPCRGVINIDLSLDLSASRSELTALEPALRDEASFERVIGENFESAYGALSEAERHRIERLRRTRQDVVLAVWAPFFELTQDELDAWVRQTTSGVTVPYLSVHGGDPGELYPGWLNGLIPGAVVEFWGEVGHYPHLVEPERFLARLRAFEKGI